MSSFVVVDESFVSHVDNLRALQRSLSNSFCTNPLPRSPLRLRDGHVMRPGPKPVPMSAIGVMHHGKPDHLLSYVTPWARARNAAANRREFERAMAESIGATP